MTIQRKIIIDTNLWISFLLSKKFDFIDYLLEVETKKMIFYCHLQKTQMLTIY